MSDTAVFDELVAEFFGVWFRYHPDVALSLGVEPVEIRLPAADDDDLSALGSWLERLIVALGSIDPSQLDAARRLDFRLLLESAQLEYQELLTRDWRHLDPPRFLPVEEIFQLTLHPREDLPGILRGLLQAVPAYLRHARAQLAELPSLIAPEMAAVAVADSETGAGYLRALADSVWLKHHCRGCDGLGPAFDTAIEAVERYTEVLRKEIAPSARGRLGCGEAYFERQLERRHFVTLPSEGLRRYLQGMLGDALRRLEALAASIGVSAQPETVLASLASGPGYAAEERLQVYREETNRLHRFLRAERLVSLPTQTFRIVERPVCPHPGICESGYLEQPDRAGGVLYVAGGNAPGGGEPRVMIRSYCLRQGWGGAHLLAYSAPPRSEGRSLPRRTAPAAAFHTAWDLLIRDALAATSYFDAADRLLCLVNRIRALQQALIDLDLNTGRIDGEEALSRLAQWQPDAAAANQVILNLARNPTDCFAGVVGWLLFHQAKEQRRTSPDFHVGEFHDAVLSKGPVPPALLIPYLFGEELWRKASDELTI